MHTINKTLRSVHKSSLHLLIIAIITGGCSRLDSITSHFQKGLTAFENSHFAQATAHFSKVIDVFPSHVQALNFLGVSQMNGGSIREAVKSLESAVQLDPAFGPAQYNLGTIYLERGQTEEAIAHLRIASRIKSTPAQAHYYLGIAYMKLSAWSQAEQAFTNYLESEPSSADTLNNLGIVTARRNRFNQAKGYFERCLSIDPKYDIASLNLGVLTERYLDQPKEALIYYKNYLSIAPDSPKASTIKSRISQLSNQSAPQTIFAGNTSGPSPDTQDSTKPHSPSSASPLTPLASVTFLMAKNDQQPTSQNQIEARANTQIPQDARSSSKEKRRSPVEQHELKPGDRARATAIVNSAFLQQQRGDLSAAIIDYNRAILTDPSFALAYYNLAIAYQSSGAANKALDNYELSLMADPNYTNARFNYALLLQGVGYTSDALNQYEILLKANPKDPSALLSAGMLCAKNRDTLDQARSYFETYLKLYPESEQARDVRIWLYQNRIKDTEAAR